MHLQPNLNRMKHPCYSFRKLGASPYLCSQLGLHTLASQTPPLLQSRKNQLAYGKVEPPGSMTLDCGVVQFEVFRHFKTLYLRFFEDSRFHPYKYIYSLKPTVELGEYLCCPICFQEWDQSANLIQHGSMSGHYRKIHKEMKFNIATARSITREKWQAIYAKEKSSAKGKKTKYWSCLEIPQRCDTMDFTGWCYFYVLAQSRFRGTSFWFLHLSCLMLFVSFIITMQEVQWFVVLNWLFGSLLSYDHELIAFVWHRQHFASDLATDDWRECHSWSLILKSLLPQKKNIYPCFSQRAKSWLWLLYLDRFFLQSNPVLP